MKCQQQQFKWAIDEERHCDICSRDGEVSSTGNQPGKCASTSAYARYVHYNNYGNPCRFLDPVVPWHWV